MDKERKCSDSISPRIPKLRFLLFNSKTARRILTRRGYLEKGWMRNTTHTLNNTIFKAVLSIQNVFGCKNQSFFLYETNFMDEIFVYKQNELYYKW